MRPSSSSSRRVNNGERILEVGCGTGSLTFALAKVADLNEIAAIDYSPVFVEEAIRRNTDPRIKSGRQMPAPCRSRAALLTAPWRCSFSTSLGKAVAEMRRVVRSGGVVAATVWDHLGGMPGMRMMVDSVAACSEAGRQLRARYCFQPMMQPGEMKRTFLEQGLADVTETQLMIRMDYLSFDDYWAPIAAGEGQLGRYVVTLDAAERARTDAAVRDANEAGRSDGPRSFANVAWACRGVVP
nr:class I SAM-dependent methyltransferase [Bradyrhizobium sp. sGM-13]